MAASRALQNEGASLMADPLILAREQAEADRDLYKQQCERLLAAIEEHQANREQHPSGPTRRNSRLWRIAQEVRGEVER